MKHTSTNEIPRPAPISLEGLLGRSLLLVASYLAVMCLIAGAYA